MKDTYVWHQEKLFEYNFAVGKIVGFVDKLMAIHDPWAYANGPGRLFDDIRDSPGAIMLMPDVPDHERDNALMIDFMPIAAYLDGEHDTLSDRYQTLLTFLMMECVEADHDAWARADGTVYDFEELLPRNVAEFMFKRWHDDHKYHGGIVERLAE